MAGPTDEELREGEARTQEAEQEAAHAQTEAAHAQETAAEAETAEAQEQRSRARRAADAVGNAYTRADQSVRNAADRVTDAARNVRDRAQGAAQALNENTQTIQRPIRAVGAKMAQAAGTSAISGWHAAFDLADFIPVFGDFAVLAVNILQILKALGGGHIGTAILMTLITAFDFGWGIALEALPVVGNFADLIFPSVILNAWLLGRAEAEKEQKETGKSTDPGSLLTDSAGDPTFFAAFLFLVAFALPVYALWTGNLVMMFPVPFILILLMMQSHFRDEFFTGYGLMFLITMALHLFLHAGLVGGYGYLLGTSGFVMNIAVYLIVTVFFFLFARQQDGDGKAAIAVSIAAIFFYSMPGMFEAFVSSQKIKEAITFFVTVIPLWPLFLATRMSREWEYGYSARTLRLYFTTLTLILLVLVVGFLISLAPKLPQFTTPSVDTQGQVEGFWGTIEAQWEKIFGGFKTLYNRARNPGEYNVDSMEEDTIGVEFIKVWGHSQNIKKGDPFLVEGSVVVIPSQDSEKQRKIESEIGPELALAPSCLLGDEIVGVPDPAILSVPWGHSQEFLCTFPDVQLRGSKKAKVDLSFSFFEDVHAKYTFFNKQTASVQQTLLAKELADSAAVSNERREKVSKGDVCLGIPDRVVLVDTDKRELENTRISVTVDDCYASGDSKLISVDRIELIVPSWLAIEEATRQVTGTLTADIPGYTVYVFSVNDFDTEWFETISAKLVLSDPAEADRFLTSTEDTVEISAKVRYTYNLADRSVNVRVIA